MSAHLERQIEQGFAGEGYTEDVAAIPNVLNWRDSGGDPLSSTSNPAVYTAGNLHSGYILKWTYDADGIYNVNTTFRMPLHYAQNQDQLKLLLLARKVDAAGVDENSDLAFDCDVYWSTPGVKPQQSILNLRTAAIAAAAPNTEPFTEYTIDLGEALSATGKRIKAGDLVTVNLAPSEQVGAADMELHLASAIFLPQRHSSTFDRTRRL